MQSKKKRTMAGRSKIKLSCRKDKESVEGGMEEINKKNIKKREYEPVH